MYLFLLLGFILSPCVSFDKCLFVIYAIVYLYIAIPIEEKIFGQTYMDYKHRVSSIVPNLFYKKKTSEK
jgi:protein-S-isoprenylcysteine O-methyltransferase Ste14